MTKKSIERHLEDHYSGQSLRDDIVRSLLDEARAGGEQVRSRSVLLRMLPLAAAAVIALALTAALSSDRGAAPGEEQFAVGKDHATQTSDRAESLPRETRTLARIAEGHQPIEIVGPREAKLVAVKFHYDGCPFSKDTQPVYEELKERFASKVAFELFNITDEEQIRESKKYASELGVEWLCERSMNSGLICLVKPKTREVVATLRSSREKEFLLAAFEEQLH